MVLWKKLHNVLLTGNTKVPKSGTFKFESGASVSAESGSTVDLAGTFKLGGTAIDATADEINRTNDASARIVTTTATTLSLTVTQHGEKVLLVNTNSTVANTFTLPVATGSGAKFTIINNIAQTQGSVVVAANGTLDVIKGLAVVAGSTTADAQAFLTSATSDKISFNRTTTGGLGQDVVECWDTAANTWNVRVIANGSGTLATPFSAT